MSKRTGTLLLSIGICLLLILVHELAHALAFQAYGFKPQQFNIGIGYSVSWLTFKAPDWFPADTIGIAHLFFLGGVVIPHESNFEAIGSLPFSAKTIIYGAGLFVHIELLILMAMAYCTHYKRAAIILLLAVLFPVIVWHVPLVLALAVIIIGMVMLYKFAKNSFSFIWKIRFSSTDQSTTMESELSEAESEQCSEIEAEDNNAIFKVKHQQWFERLLEINLVLLCYNCIPLLMFDGGKVWQAFAMSINPSFSFVSDVLILSTIGCCVVAMIMELALTKLNIIEE